MGCPFFSGVRCAADVAMRSHARGGAWSKASARYRLTLAESSGPEVMHSARRCQSSEPRSRGRTPAPSARWVLRFLFACELVLFLHVHDRDLQRGLDLRDTFTERAHPHLLARAAS